MANFSKLFLILTLLYIFYGFVGTTMLYEDKPTLAFGMYTLSIGISYVIFSNLIERLRLKYLPLLIGITIQGILALLYIFIKSRLIFLLFGIISALYIPCLDAIASEKVRKVSAWGKLEALEDIAYGMAMIIGGYIADSSCLLLITFILSLMISLNIIEDAKREFQR